MERVRALVVATVVLLKHYALAETQNRHATSSSARLRFDQVKYSTYEQVLVQHTLRADAPTEKNMSHRARS